jgi:general secretion pathway protein G
VPKSAAIVMAVLTVVACRDHAADRDADLKQALSDIRGAITRYHADTGRFPESLSALVPKYIAVIPVDPMTGSASTWRVTTEETVQPNADFTAAGTSTAARPAIIDVHSGAGAPYSNY